MLDIKKARENPEAIKANLAKRNDPKLLEMVDTLLEKDALWKKEKGELDFLKGQRNSLSQEINKAKKEGKDIKALLAKVKSIPQEIAEKEKKVIELETQIKFYLMRVPNLLHDSVPEGLDATGNIVVETGGKKPQFSFPVKSHIDIQESLGLTDIERAAKLSGARFYFLKGELAELELSLQKYAIDFMTKRGFMAVNPPFMMNRKAYEGVTDLGAFEDVLYKIEGEDLYLIATSEHPLTAMYMDEVFEQRQLPIKMVGYSTCFRKEAGAHGKDTKGIFRVHQFNKIEQIILCKPEDSWKFHEEIKDNIRDFFESLGLFFHVITLCSGDTGKVSAKTYDLEAWMPSSQEFREMGSASNCTSYQAIRLNLKYNTSEGNAPIHTLNSTCVATTRALCAILEQFQQSDGSVKIPDVLVPYMNGKTFIGKPPF